MASGRRAAAVRRSVLMLFAGAVSGSYLTWDQAQGSASIYGVTIPNTMDIPTTAVAGVRAGVEKNKRRFLFFACVEYDIRPMTRESPGSPPLVYLISDDNYSRFQRTLLLQFRLDPDELR